MQDGAQITFGTRLQSLLTEVSQNQAWLAEKVGVERSTISRLVAGDRCPAVSTLQDIATVLGVSVEELVRGTSIEQRTFAAMKDAQKFVRRADHDALLKTLLEFETRNNDLERKLREADREYSHERDRRGEVERQQGELHHRLSRAETDLQRTSENNRLLQHELQRYRRALNSAVAELASHRAKIDELAEELKANSKSSQTAAILAGVAAFAGVLTATSFLGDDDDDGSEGSAPSAKRTTKAKRRKQ